MYGPFSDISSCDVRKGFCALGNQILIWTFKQEIWCPLYEKEPVTLKVFTKTSDELSLQPYRLELLELGISIHNFGKCPARIQGCFGQNPYCTDAGFVILSSINCDALTARSTVFK